MGTTHIKPNGDPGRCNAEKGKCPFFDSNLSETGGHFDDNDSQAIAVASAKKKEIRSGVENRKTLSR